MAKLLLIRHGETLWNREHRFQGSADIPLSEKGQQQAQQVAARLADKPLAAIYSSPLSRALDTARQVAGHHGLPVQVVADIQEINVGQWSGKTWEEIEQLWPELGPRWRANPYTSPPPPGGEAYRQFQRRCIDALDGIAAQHREQHTVAVICHGGVIRAVLSSLLGLEGNTRGRLYSLNCSITQLRWQAGGDVIVDCFNDSYHLGD